MQIKFAIIIVSLIDNNTYGFSINSIWKFSKNIINAFKGNFYNYHAAEIPSERGAGNISWKILLNNINVFKKCINYRWLWINRF